MTFSIPPHPILRAYVLDQLVSYWKKGKDKILDLPITRFQGSRKSYFSPEILPAPLPDWAKHLGVNGNLSVPQVFSPTGQVPDWRKVDWFSSIFWFLNSMAERNFERKAKPIHSNSFRLTGWSSEIWNCAWVNRIALFLRMWASEYHDCDEISLFGPLPEPKILLTFDLDAIEKTLPIRLKQSLFHVFNGMRALSINQFSLALSKFRQALTFLLTDSDFNFLDKVVQMAKERGMLVKVFVHARCKQTPNRIFRWIFDPGYKISKNPGLVHSLRSLLQAGIPVGLHPSFLSWEDPSLIEKEKHLLEKTIGVKVSSCRQHWLKFSWERTWKAQEKSGIAEDWTLGFNDIPGFRNSAAICFSPWDFDENIPLTIRSIPNVFMDSHFYDYKSLSKAERKKAIEFWLDEIWTVRGISSVIWHPHTFAKDYNWTDGLNHILSFLEGKRKTEDEKPNFSGKDYEK